MSVELAVIEFREKRDGRFKPRDEQSEWCFFFLVDFKVHTGAEETFIMRPGRPGCRKVMTSELLVFVQLLHGGTAWFAETEGREEVGGEEVGGEEVGRSGRGTHKADTLSLPTHHMSGPICVTSLPPRLNNPSQSTLQGKYKREREVVEMICKKQKV